MRNFSVFLTVVLLAAIILLVDPYAYHSFTVPKHHLLIVLAPLLLLVTIRKSRNWMVGLIPFLFLIRLIWLSMANPHWVIHPGNDSFFLYLSLWIILLAASQIKLSDYVRNLFPSLFLMGIAETAIGIWQLSVYVPNPSTPVKTAMIGTLGTPNGLGLLLVLSFISGVFFLKKVTLKWLQVLTTLGLLFILCGIILSESRGAVLALIVSSLVVGFLYFKTSNSLFINQLKLYKLSLFLIAVLFFAGLAYGLYTLDRASSQGRLMAWNISWEMIKDYPTLGVGQGNYSVEYLDYQARYLTNPENLHLQSKAANLKQAHNEFIQAFAEGGFFGGILFLLIWLLPMVYGLKTLLQSKLFNWNLVGAMAIHISIITHSLVDSPLHVLPVAFIGYVNLAMVSMPKRGFRLSATSKNFIILIIIIYCSAMIFRAFRIYPAYHDWKKGVDLVSQQKWKPAVFHYQRALDRLGKKGELEYHIGAALVFDGQYSKGIYYLNQAKKGFNDRNIYLSESYANLKLEMYGEAERLAQKVLRMFPDHLSPHLLLGEIYFYMGRYELSKISLKKCIEMDTKIISPEVKQISREAKEFWKSKYGLYK